MLDAIEAAFAPYVKDRGLDWEINIDQGEDRQRILHARLLALCLVTMQAEEHWRELTGMLPCDSSSHQ